ncbi:tripartite tricarboxylate transporter substrate-binding protein [Variovorax sp. J22G21]|nr:MULTISPECIES: tripartite tricarboxylate transporter substrate-binding protein [unclassified Variovorax]MDM0041749.1 tripartite tricarboxylate transporter substrate-binding protein [Variovorax sp. J22R193]MDM0059588.1 tripartite tricarboxylate transporter substrate-binding protein [Variovorax sp. J22G21]
MATPGAGSLAHLVAEMLQCRAGATFNHVAYRGSTPIIVADTAAGHVDAAFSSFASGKALVDTGKLRPVAVTGERRRLAVFPQVPTFEELGFREMKVDTWWRQVESIGIPAPVIARLQTELTHIVALPVAGRNMRRSTSRRLQAVGASPIHPRGRRCDMDEGGQRGPHLSGTRRFDVVATALSRSFIASAMLVSTESTAHATVASMHHERAIVLSSDRVWRLANLRDQRNPENATTLRF